MSRKHGAQRSIYGPGFENSPAFKNRYTKSQKASKAARQARRKQRAK